MKGAQAAVLAIVTLGVALGLGAMSGAELKGGTAATEAAVPAEVGTMVVMPAGALDAGRCVTCHETSSLHECSACHDVHGDAVLPGIQRTHVLTVAGDVAHPAQLPVAHLVERGDRAVSAALPLATLLEEQGAGDWTHVVLRSPDGGEVTIPREDLPPDALLTPWIDGVRFSTEEQHISTWLKGIDQIVVVGREVPLTVGGEPTSIGRLLAGPTRTVTAQPAEVRLAGQGGRMRTAVTSSRLEGAPLGELVDGACERGITVRTLHGKTQTYDADAACGAVLAQQMGTITVVPAGAARSTWTEWVVAVEPR